MIAPAFDRCAIEAHVSLLHDLAEGLDGVLILAAFAERGAAQVQRFQIGDVNGMVGTIMGFENHPNLNLYAPWSVFRRDLEPGRKGRESDAAVLAAVADMDGDKGIRAELPTEAPYIIETSPGNCQPVYVFDKPMSAGDAKPVLTALSDFIGGDSGTKDCSHVWRIPGTLNIPTKTKLARGRAPVPAAVTVKKQFNGRFTSPAELLALAPRPRPNGPDPAPQRSLSFDEEARLRTALATMPANDRDAWLKVGAALHLHGARAVWDDWSRTSSKFDAADQDRVWASFHADRKDVVTIATIYAWAKERGWRKTGNGDDPALARVVARPFVWRDPKTIPPRQWLYGQHYIRKFVSATIAAPGIGKSSLNLVELIATASGRPLLGVPVPKQLRVWYWNLEDPYDEIERRIAAVLLHFNIDPAEIEGRLFVNSGRDDPLVIAEKHRDSFVINTPIAEALAAEIIARGVDVLSPDPFVSCHRVPENDNGAIDAVTKTWAKVADIANCSIDLVHHVRKPANSQAEFDVNDARGASALIGTARAARVLNSMTKEDAETAGVSLKHKGYYFSVTNGKANMRPPAEKADWFKFVSVPLGNDTAETKGDDVGVVTKWKFPGLFDEMAASDLFAIQKAIAAAQWRADARSPDWVGNAVAKVLELNVSAPADKKRIKSMLAIWIETRALKEAERNDQQRKPKLFVEVGNWANT